MKLGIKNHLNSKYYVLNVMGCYWPTAKDLNDQAMTLEHLLPEPSYNLLKNFSLY